MRFTWHTFLLLTLGASTRAIDDISACTLTYLPRRFLTIDITHECAISDENPTLASCKADEAPFVFDYLRAHPTVSALHIDCRGDWVEFDGVGKTVANISGLNLKRLSVTNCQFAGASAVRQLIEGLEDSLEALSVMCCSFLTGDTQPIYANFKRLHSITLHNNRYFPYESSAEHITHSTYWQTTAIDFVNLTKCAIPASMLQSGQCMCSANDSAGIEMACFDVHESDLTALLNWLNERGTHLRSLQMLGFTFDVRIPGVHEQAHPLSFALHLCNSMSSMTALKIHSCHWQATNRTQEYKLTKCSQGTLHTLSISNCKAPEPRAVDKPSKFDTFLKILYKFPDTLTVLDLSSTNLTGLYGILNSLPYETLILAGNRLKELTANSLVPYASTLKTLNLQYNELSIIKEATFKDLPKLRYLGLSGNKFSLAEPSWFEDLDRLVTLDMGFFPTFSLNSDNFYGLQSLSTLSLAHIQNPTVSSMNAFRGLGSLYSLTLADSEYANFPDKMLRPLHSLAVLNAFAAGEILKLPDATMKVLSHAETLRALSYDLDTVVLPCPILGRMPLLREIMSSTGTVHCAPTELMKWLQARLQLGKLTLRASERISCDETNVSLAHYLNSTDFSQVSLTMLYADEDDALDSDTTSYDDNDDDDEDDDGPNPVIQQAIVGISVASALLLTCVFVIYLLFNPASRKKWFTLSWRSWFCERGEPCSKMVKHFYESACFEGLNRAAEHKSLAPQLFWHLLMIVFVGVTVRALCILYLQWYYGDPNTNINLATAQSFADRPFTICMPATMRNITLTDDELEGLFTDPTHCRPEGDLPYDLKLFLDVLMHRLGFQMIAEMVLAPNTTMEHSFYNISKLDTLLEERNLSLRKVQKKVSAALCRVLEINAYSFTKAKTGEVIKKTIFHPNNCSALFVNSTRYGLTWFDDQITQKMCIRFPGIFSFQGNSLSGQLSLQPWRILSPDDTVTVDLNGFPTVVGINTLGNAVQVSQGMVTKLEISLESTMHQIQYTRASKEPRCLRNCFANQRIADIQDRCECRPILWAGNTDESLPDCNINTIHEKCPTTPSTSDCQGTIPCLTRKYRVDKQTIGVADSGATVFKLHFQNDVYTVFAQEINMEISDLFGTLGGIICFWLGATFTGLIHCAYYLGRFALSGVDCASNWAQRKRKFPKDYSNGDIEMRHAQSQTGK